MRGLFAAPAEMLRSSQYRAYPDPRAVEAMQIADQFLSTATQSDCEIERLRVDHSIDQGRKLEVVARRAKTISYGVRLLTADLIVIDDSVGTMGLYLERRKLRRYCNLSDDTFIDLVLSHFTTHLDS